MPLDADAPAPAARAAVLTYARALAAAAPRKLALAFALAISVGVTEGVGTLLLLPLLELAGVEVGGGSAGRLARAAAAPFTALGLTPSLPAVLAVYALAVSARALLQRQASIADVDLAESFGVHLRRRLYRAVADADWAFLTRARATSLSHALTEEVDRASAAAYDLLALAAQLCIGAAYLGLALQLSPLVTAVAAGSGVALLVVMRRSSRRARLAGERLSDATDAMFDAASEHIAALKTAKSYRAEERSAAVFDGLSTGVAAANRDTGRLYANTRLTFDVGSTLLLCAILLVALVTLRIPTAGVLLLLFLFARLVPRFSGAQSRWQEIAHAVPAYATVMTLIERCEASAEEITRSGPSPGGAPDRPAMLATGIALEDVSFRYAPELPDAVTGLRLDVRAGRMTAIVGPSGAGKSTIADLVMGLLRPTAGRVLVDGVPLDGLLRRAWRERIGYVAQETFLFHDTVRANLLWAKPDATDDELARALRLAAADEFVHRLPRGLDTVIGDRGSRLSGGERQRLALARAVIRDPALLILDEATSAVDGENEARILRAIDALPASVTILVITHRLTTVRGADTIHVVEQGRVIETGAWDELLGRDGRFTALCAAQGVAAGATAAGATAAGATAAGAPTAPAPPPTAAAAHSPPWRWAR